MTKSMKKFIVLWFGQLTASIGHGLTTFALSVFAFSVSKSAVDASMVMLLGFLPYIILIVPSGVLADKYDRRLLMILGDGLSALGILYILIMKMNGNLSLIDVYIGVTISSIFSALMTPAYQATVSDILSKDEYIKASGLIQISNSAKFLISPVLAGFLIGISKGFEIILLIDILTVFVTIATSFYIKSGLESKVYEIEKDFFKSLYNSWKILKNNRGVFDLVLISTALTFFIAFIQTLSSPYFLSFSNSETLGKAMTVAAFGMLLSGSILGVSSIKKNHIKYMALSLFLAGMFMFGFGLTINIYIITLFGFLFFSTLPVANSTIDYMIRINLDNQHEGRIWSFITFISQMGFVLAYPTAGLLADNIFTPIMSKDGLLGNSIGKIMGVGNGKGIGLLIMIAGICLSLTALIIIKSKNIRNLEKNKSY
ncbi:MULTISPECIES: MFS transporter [Helcococcus]|uniref:MFS transporter n=1 Tax=Helcococcus bovis TaxID=3153252 RepID=A0ABW9F886_9FIRM